MMMVLACERRVPATQREQPVPSDCPVAATRGKLWCQTGQVSVTGGTRLACLDAQDLPLFGQELLFGDQALVFHRR